MGFWHLGFPKIVKIAISINCHLVFICELVGSALSICHKVLLWTFLKKWSFILSKRYLEPRAFGAINWRGLWTLYAKEVRRFLKVYTQTLLAPVITSLLFLAIFNLALGQAIQVIGGISFIEFLTPGLIMMMIAQNGFANTSSSILIAKIQGNIVDVLMPPIGPAELMLAYVASGLTRGVMVGIVTLMAMYFFVSITIHHLGVVIFFTCLLYTSPSPRD